MVYQYNSTTPQRPNSLLGIPLKLLVLFCHYKKNSREPSIHKFYNSIIKQECLINSTKETNLIFSH